MKKNITLLLISFFLLVSCSSDEDSPVIIIPSSPTTTQAVLNGGSVNVTWSAVEGAGITYNVYRSDSPLKINTVPLTEAKFTDVLKTTGSFTYTITSNLGGVESPKGVISEKVILELPKTTTRETIDKYYDTKYEYAFTYDTSDITKLATVTINLTDTNVKTKEVKITKSISKYTYTGDFITKIMSYTDDNILKSSSEYVYNEQKKLKAVIAKKADGSINYTISYTYNEDGTITETDDSPGSGPAIYTFEKGNLVKYSATTPVGGGNEYVVVTNSVYDSKNGSNTNVAGLNLLLSYNKNNSISSSSVYNYNGEIESTETSKSDYIYNPNGYVLTKMKSVITSAGITIQTEETVVTYY